MEHLLFIAIVLALVEYRRFQQKQDVKDLLQLLKKHDVALKSILAKDRHAIAQQIGALSERLAPMEAFISQAQADLAFVVKEHGIRAEEKKHLREAQSYDYVEGL